MKLTKSLMKYRKKKLDRFSERYILGKGEGYAQESPGG